MKTDSLLFKVSGETTKGKKCFFMFYAVAAFIISLLFSAYTVSALIDGDRNPLNAVPACAALLGLFALLFYKKFPRGIKIFLFCGMYAFVVSYLALSVYIFSFSFSEEMTAMTKYESDEEITVMAFGCRTYGYTPGRSLESRLRSALKLLEAYPNSICIVTGGQGENETVSEAESMRCFLTEHGISSERIYKEERSSNTIENLMFSFELMKKEGIDTEKIIGISNRYHLARISWLAGKQGVTMSFFPADSDNIFRLSVYLLREYMSYAKIIVTG